MHAHIPASLMMPRTAATSIADSQEEGGAKTYCSAGGRYNHRVQGQLPVEFWSNVEFDSGVSGNGGRYAQRMSSSLSLCCPFGAHVGSV